MGQAEPEGVGLGVPGGSLEWGRRRDPGKPVRALL